VERGYGDDRTSGNNESVNCASCGTIGFHAMATQIIACTDS
jgi:hypothetical protein